VNRFYVLENSYSENFMLLYLIGFSQNNAGQCLNLEFLCELVVSWIFCPIDIQRYIVKMLTI